MTDGLLLTEHQEHALLFMIITFVFPMMAYYLRKLTIIVGRILLRLETVSTLVENCPYCTRKFERDEK